MAKSKIVSQKRFVKGLNAGTGILTQPPSTVIRISNIFFNQRGSLTTTNGSAIIGQLQGTNLKAVAVGTFSTLAPGQYPYYPTVTAPPDYLLPNVTNFAASPSGSSGNAAGAYVFAICANNGSLHSDPAQSQVTMTAGSTFAAVDFSWDDDGGATTYSVYYLPGGLGSTQGVLLSSPTASPYTFTGTLPTTPLVSLPVGNTSYTLGVQIGNLVPPSKQVYFVTPAETLTSIPPQPAALNPGDPNFQYQTAFQSRGGSFTGTGGATATASQAGKGSTTVNGSPTAALPSVAVNGIVSFSTTIQGTCTFDIPGGSCTASFQVSGDGGSTWMTYYTWTNPVDGEAVPLPAGTIVTGIATVSSSLSNLLFRVSVTATASISQTTDITADITAFSVTFSPSGSFTPYGGVPGYADWIPQILQFDQLAILILGNGLAPVSFDPSQLASATFTPLSNTFQATYPDWQASVDWTTGNTIAVLVSGTNYVFTALQGGVSGATAPTWPTTLNSTVSDGQVVWQNTGPLNTSVAPRGAAHGIVYAGSLWLANTYPQTTSDQIDGPTCLKMSDSDNPNSWNPVNVAFLGKDDGTQITGLATFTIAEVGIAPTQSLVCFKEFSTYQILGVFGATDFQITQAQTDLGCIAARSIQFLTGYGIARMTHMGFAIFDGVRDRIISEEIRPYLFGGIQLNADITGIDFSYVYISQGCQTSTPPMYICACPLAGANGLLSRLFVYDLVLKAWTILDLPWTVTALLQARSGEGTPLMIGFRGDGTGILERFFAGDLSWDAVSLVGGLIPSPTPIKWAFSTVYIYDEGSSRRAFYRKVTIRGYSAQTVASLVTVTIACDGNPPTSYQAYLQPQPFSGQFQLDVDLLFTGQIVNLNATGTGVVTIDGLDWEVSSKPGGEIMIG